MRRAILLLGILGAIAVSATSLLAQQRTRPYGERSIAPEQPTKGAPLRVGGDVRQPRKTKNVNPICPDSARRVGVHGAVTVEFTIDTGGKVTDARIVRSMPPFDDAALTAVKQWQYEPTVLHGTAIPVLLTAVVRFPSRL